jgi:mRNA interferase MazF
MAKRTGAKPPGAKSGRREYVPDVGDLVWFSFSPQAGREQAGRRPGVVLSPRSYNSSARLCIVCPVTSQAKAYPFEVPLPADAAIPGVVLADHVRSADWQVRNAEYAGVVPAAVLDEVRAKLQPLLGM